MTRLGVLIVLLFGFLAVTGNPVPHDHTEEEVSAEEPPAPAPEPPAPPPEPPVIKEEPPVVKEEPPVSKEETSVSKEETPVSKEDPPASKEELPVSKEDPTDSKDGYYEVKSFKTVHRVAFCQFPYRWIYYWHSKGGFFSESEIRFSNLPIFQKNYSKKLSWAWNLDKLFTDMGGNFKFQAQDSFLE